MTGRDRRNTKQAIAARMEAQRQTAPVVGIPIAAPAEATCKDSLWVARDMGNPISVPGESHGPRPAPSSAPYVAPVKPSPADLEVSRLLTQMSESDGDLTPIQEASLELFRDLTRDLVLHLNHPASLDALIDRLPALGTAVRLGIRNALLAAES